MIGFGWLGVPVVLAVLLFAWLCFTKVRDEGALLGRALFVFAAQVVGVLLVLSLLWLALVRKPRADEAQAQRCLDAGGWPVFVDRGFEFRCLTKGGGR